MKKKRRSALILLAVFLCASGGALASEPRLRADLPRNTDGYHEGGSVSDAWVDPDETAVDESSLKAVLTDYDPEKLTYELVWADEFDTDGRPDKSKWGYDTGGSGWGNHELQYYTPGDNAAVSDGVLTITAQKERMGGRDYTSCRLVSRDRGDFLYCKVVARARLPEGLGTWPAVWMLPTDWAYGSWPASGEIDIMEHVGYDPNVIVQSVHVEKFHGGAAKNHSIRAEDVFNEFHDYGVEWLPDRIIFSVDGETTWTYRPLSFTDRPQKDVWPFDKRMHLLINLAFGGDWGGARGIDESCLPARYEIDYIRVYQSPEIMALTGQI